MKAIPVYGRDFSVTTQVDEEHKVATLKPFFLILVISLFLLIFLGFMVARRNNRRQLNNGNTEGEQPDEEQQQMLIATASADQLVVFQQINQVEIEANHDQAHQRRHCLYTLEAKCNLGTRLACVNFILEIPSAVFDQIESAEKPAFILILMLISFVSMLLGLVELVCKGRKEKITWRWKWKWSSGRIPWFYHPPPSNRCFGTFTEIIGLVCAMAQCIVTTINFFFFAFKIKIMLPLLKYLFGL